MGGAVPYLAERFDRGYEAFAECRENISRAPSSYLKQFYYDTVNFDLNCIELAIKFAGVDHILRAATIRIRSAASRRCSMRSAAAGFTGRARRHCRAQRRNLLGVS
jgi:aminocarboxymuconate-semialdehyde decarboxylase